MDKRQLEHILTEYAKNNSISQESVYEALDKTDDIKKKISLLTNEQIEQIKKDIDKNTIIQLESIIEKIK